MAARSRKAASAKPKAKQEVPAQPENEAVKWFDTWRQGKAKVTLFAFLADNKLCVKVTTETDEPMYLNSEELSSYLDAEPVTVRGWLGDATRFGTSVQAALDAYFTERGWKSSAAYAAAKADRLAALGL